MGDGEWGMELWWCLYVFELYVMIFFGWCVCVLWWCVLGRCGGCVVEWGGVGGDGRERKINSI